MITADGLLDQIAGQHDPWVEGVSDDFDLDDRPEVQLANDRLVALVAPSRGGQLYELDVRSISHNLLATLSRRPEAYHRSVLAGPGSAGGSVIDANVPIKFKQAGLERHLQYDRYSRKSLIDHFHDDDVSLDSLYHNEAMERGDFAQESMRRSCDAIADRVQVQLSRSGNAWGIPLKITKGITMHAGSSTLEVAYYLEGLPRDRTLHFSVEFNFAGLPAGADDRYYYTGDDQRLGQLGSHLNLTDAADLNLVDEWLGIDVGLAFNSADADLDLSDRDGQPIGRGFRIDPSSGVCAAALVLQGDAEGRWSVAMQLSMDTSQAEGRRHRRRRLLNRTCRFTLKPRTREASR